MAGVENPQFVPFLVQGVEQVVGLPAWQSEDGVDAVAAHGLDDGLPAGQFGHNRISLNAATPGSKTP